ncbi:MAG: hypothetical protein EBZ77_02605, partial [Chitinophagia bacterium]|nr:hypothetical protein [Chitinophagia bacterium]
CCKSAEIPGPLRVSVRAVVVVPTTSAPIVASEMLVGSAYATTDTGVDAELTNDDCTVPSGPRALTNR